MPFRPKHKSTFSGIAIAAALAVVMPAQAGFLDDVKKAVKDAGREIRKATGGTAKPPSPSQDSPVVTSQENPVTEVPLSRDQVRQIQQSLNQLGYPVGTADGIQGRKTRDGAGRFRADRNLPGGGQVNALLLQQLGQAAETPAVRAAAGRVNEPARTAPETSKSPARSAAGSPAVASPGADQSQARSAQAGGGQAPRPVSDRLRRVNGYVLLPDAATPGRHGSLFTAKQFEAVQEYGMLLGLKLNAAPYSEFVPKGSRLGEGFSRALCIVNEYSDETLQSALLSPTPSVMPSMVSGRAKGRTLMRFWQGDNEFAQRRTSTRFVKSELPRYVDAAGRIPMKVAIATRVALGRYDFERQGFQFKNAPAFTAKWKIEYSNVKLPSECGTHAQLLPPTALVGLGDFLKMSPDEAESFSDTVARATGRRSSSVILHQVTYAQLNAVKDRSGRLQYRAEPVSTELFADKNLTTRVAQFGVGGRAGRSAQASRAPAAAPKPTTKPVTRVNPSIANAAPNQAADNNAANSGACQPPCQSPALQNPDLRRIGGALVMPGLLATGEIGFSPQSSNALNVLMDWLAVSAWLKQGGSMSVGQKDRFANRVALCAANDFLTPDKKRRYLGGKSVTTSKRARRTMNWSGADQFGQRRARVDFVKNEWPAIERSLPGLPAQFALVSQFSLNNYDFKRQGFPIKASPETWYNTGSTCGFMIRIAGATDKLPTFMSMTPDKAEQLLEKISQLRPKPGRTMNRSPHVFAVIKARGRATNVVTQASRNDVTFQMQPQRLELYLDAGLKNLVGAWNIANPKGAARQQPSRGAKSKPASQPKQKTTVGATAPAVSQSGAGAASGASQVLNYRRLFNDTDLLVALGANGTVSISNAAAQAMVRDQQKLDKLYYDQTELRFPVNGGARRVALPGYEPDVEPYFTKGERVNVNGKKNGRLLKKYAEWRLKGSPPWPRKANVLVQLRASGGLTPNSQVLLDLTRWEQIRSNDSAVRHRGSAVAKALQGRDIELSRVYQPLLNIRNREPYRQNLLRQGNKYQVPLFVLPFDYEDIRLPFNSGALAKKMGTKLSTTVPAELELEMQSFELVPVNERVELVIIKAKPIELRVPTADMQAVAVTHSFRQGPGGDSAGKTKTFADRRLEVLGVRLGMTLGESVAAAKAKLSGEKITDVSVASLRQSGSLSVTPCRVKQSQISRQVKSKHAALLTEQRRACQTAAGSDSSARQACVTPSRTLKPEAQAQLTSLQNELTAALPAECALKNKPYVPYAGFDVDYGDGLKDRIVLYGSGGANADDPLVAMSRVFTDKSASLDFLARLNEVFGGNAYGGNRRSPNRAHWFERADLHDKVVAHQSFRKQCGIDRGTGLSTDGKISRRFDKPCGRYVAYQKSKSYHFVLMIDSDHGSKVSAQRASGVEANKKKVQSRVKF